MTAKLVDCCWVELEGYARPELVIQKRLKPRIFAVRSYLYDEQGVALLHNQEAPRILAVLAPQSQGRRAGSMSMG